jgi:hypothetical protein
MVDNTGRSVAHTYGTGAQSKEEPPRWGCADDDSACGRRPPVECRGFSPSGCMSSRHRSPVGLLLVDLPLHEEYPMRKPLSVPALLGTLHTVRLQTGGAPRGVRPHPVRLFGAGASTAFSIRVERTHARSGCP